MTLSTARRPPLLLLHGVTSSARAWDRVAPLLQPDFTVLAPTLLGHRDGAPAPARRPVGIAAMVDDAERIIDELGVDTIDIAGNSMGGWIALELARRGRARSVCALSPAGAWGDHPQQLAGRRILRRGLARARKGHRIAAVLAAAPPARRALLRDVALRGHQLTSAQVRDVLADLVQCTVSEDLLNTSDRLEPFAATCPVTLAWSEADRIFPPEINGASMRDRVGGSRWLLLPDVGHVPMYDNPVLVANTIRAATGLKAHAPMAGDPVEARSGWSKHALREALDECLPETRFSTLGLDLIAYASSTAELLADPRTRSSLLDALGGSGPGDDARATIREHLSRSADRMVGRAVLRGEIREPVSRDGILEAVVAPVWLGAVMGQEPLSDAELVDHVERTLAVHAR